MKRKEKVAIMKNIALVTQIGVTIIATILVALFIGKTLDGWLGTGMIFTLVLLVMGIVSAFMTILRLGLKEKNKKLEDWGEEDDDDENHSDS